MTPGPRPPKARQFLERLAAAWRYHFDSAEARAALGETAAKSALSRLARQGAIRSPARGFYVIVPPAEPAGPMMDALPPVLDLAGPLGEARPWAHRRPPLDRGQIQKRRVLRHSRDQVREGGAR